MTYLRKRKKALKTENRSAFKAKWRIVKGESGQEQPDHVGSD